ncbi:MAG TPA: class I SAM-dependent methyltransferase [Actinomycetota bacterium]
MSQDTAREELERELYWAQLGEPGRPVRTAEELSATLKALERDLRASLTRPEPPPEWEADRGPRWKRKLKGMLARILRPVSRRYDRVTGDLASLTSALAERVRRAEADIRRLEAGLTEARRGLPAPRPVELPPEFQDSYYWRYEARMRGEPESIVARLAQYEGIAGDVRAKAPGVEGEPLWLDVGCGRGEFGELVQGWGWRALGIDVSPGAIEASLARGIDAAQADVFEYLRDYDGEPPVMISAIQVIEHLPKDTWLAFFRATRRALAEGGALIVETINPLVFEALSGAFIADVTHTWPPHPETLRLMALHAGFATADLMYLNEDEQGAPRDFALVARTA